MALLENLLRASFNDEEFLISTSSTAGGRKDQLHEFPNSDKQNIEDLGLKPRSYNIVGWITEPNYIDKRDALLGALESGETGVLSHPFYGEIENLKARSFSINESIQELGRAEISMVFEISNTIGIPEETGSSLSSIFSSNDDVQISVNSEISNNWNVTSGFLGNFSSAQDKLGEIESAYNTFLGPLVFVQENINAFNSLVGNFGSAINSLISTPSELATSFTNLGSGFNSLQATVDSQVEAWKGMFNFGDNDTVTKEDTAGLIERKKNNDTINVAMQVQATSYAFLAGAQVELETVEDLDELAVTLETQFQKVIANNSMGNDLREKITIMREDTNIFFNQLRVGLSRIIEVSTPELPARVISYQYYKDSSLGEEIASLNSNANLTFLEGNIQVVTQ